MQSCGGWSCESQLVGWHWQAWNAPPLLWCHCICYAWWLLQEKKFISCCKSTFACISNLSSMLNSQRLVSAMTELEWRSSFQPITTDHQQASCAFRLPVAGTLYTTINLILVTKMIWIIIMTVIVGFLWVVLWHRYGLFMTVNMDNDIYLVELLQYSC